MNPLDRSASYGDRSPPYGPFNPTPTNFDRNVMLGLRPDGSPMSVEERNMYTAPPGVINPYTNGMTPIFGAGNGPMRDGYMNGGPKLPRDAEQGQAGDDSRSAPQVKRTCQQPRKMSDKEIHDTIITLAFKFKLSDMVTSQSWDGEKGDNMPYREITIGAEKLEDILKPKIRHIDRIYKENGGQYSDINRVLPIKLEILEKRAFTPIPVCVTCENAEASNWNAENVIMMAEPVNPKDKEGDTQHHKVMVQVDAGNTASPCKTVLFDHCHFIKSAFFANFGCFKKDDLKDMFRTAKKGIAWVGEGNTLYIYLQNYADMLKTDYPDWVKEREIRNEKAWVSFPVAFVNKIIAAMQRTFPDMGTMNISEGLTFRIKPTSGSVEHKSNYTGNDSYGNLKELNYFLTVRLKLTYVFPRTKLEEQEARERLNSQALNDDDDEDDDNDNEPEAEEREKKSPGKTAQAKSSNQNKSSDSDSKSKTNSNSSDGNNGKTNNSNQTKASAKKK